MEMLLEDIIKEQMDKFYSEMLGYVEAGQHELNLDPRTIVMTDLVEKHVPKDARIIDIGAGLGDLLGQLKERGYTNLAAMDFSNVAEKYFQKKFGDAVPFYKRDISRPKQLEGLGPYDLVIMGDILEHIWGPKRALLGIRSLLKDGGKYLVSVPNAGFILNGLILSFFPHLYNLSIHLGTWSHINTYTKFRLKAHLGTCGFEPIEIVGSPSRLYYPPARKYSKKFERFFIMSLFRICELLRPLSMKHFSQNIIALTQKVGGKIEVDPLSPFTA